ncbi:hypothetical protein F5888DRAFT_1655232 [Russula emetica]|nr:hypothetical protein F5888DRAFT_1655232 [Russula emetica]
MEGASSGLAGHLDNILPKDAQFVLAWNPPQLRTEGEADVILHTQEPPDTALSALRTTTIGSSRQAAFYDRHLASHLTLERVVYFDTLVSTMANTVDQAIQDAVTKRPLPKDTSVLQSEKQIEYADEVLFPTVYREMGVASRYLKYTSTYCLPIASTLALHPSSGHWASILNWTMDGKIGRWAIADDDGKKGIIEQLAFRKTTLAVWEMKSLTVGTAQVMEEIVEMGLTHAKFPWKKCAPTVCNHRLWEGMEESRESYDAGFDARSPPWTLPIVPSSSAADSRQTSLRKGLRSASAQGGTNTGQSYKEPSMSPVEDGEGVRRKRRRNDSDSSEYDRPPPKKSKADSMDESYEPPPGARQEVNAQSFLQQTWAQAVRNKCTIMVLHSGNHEIIGIRHRKTQTLYISRVIEPHCCSNPAYGKIQVGIYIAAIQETMDRARQDIEAREKRARDPSPSVSLRNEEANPDRDLDGYSTEGPTRPNKRSRGSGSKGKRQGGRKGNAKRHASGKEIDEQALLANAARQNHLCLRFFYDIYDSTHPAAFCRGVKRHRLSVCSIHITVHSELQPGSTGIVHVGTMAVDPSGLTAKVAVKLAFSKDEKSRLKEEHRVYSYLHSKGVQGIPRDIGLFVNEEPLLGAEGPYALVMSYAGDSLFGHFKRASDSVRDSLLATLRSIHSAGILHGDIRLPNLCVTASGEAFVVDFSHATKNRSRKEKAQEIKDLAHILGMDLPTEPAAKDVEHPVVLRRSARIKELEQRKLKVEPKNEQVKRGKSTRRK